MLHAMSCPFPESCNCGAGTLNKKDARIRELEQRLEASENDVVHAFSKKVEQTLADETARADAAEQRVTDLTAANQGWQMVEDERAKFVADLDQRNTELVGLLQRAVNIVSEIRPSRQDHPDERLLTGILDSLETDIRAALAESPNHDMEAGSK